MSDKPTNKPLKSAYEAALERLEQQGIERPREESLTEEVRQQIAEARNRSEAQLAELEIMHRQRLQKTSPADRQQELDEYRQERQRIEALRDRKIAALRSNRAEES